MRSAEVRSTYNFPGEVKGQLQPGTSQENPDLSACAPENRPLFPRRGSSPRHLLNVCTSPGVMQREGWGRIWTGVSLQGGDSSMCCWQITATSMQRGTCPVRGVPENSLLHSFCMEKRMICRTSGISGRRPNVLQERDVLPNVKDRACGRVARTKHVDGGHR